MIEYYSNTIITIIETQWFAVGDWHLRLIFAPTGALLSIFYTFDLHNFNEKSREPRKYARTYQMCKHLCFPNLENAGQTIFIGVRKSKLVNWEKILF